MLILRECQWFHPIYLYILSLLPIIAVGKLFCCFKCFLHFCEHINKLSLSFVTVKA